jgi:hypothetical protein
LNVKCSCILIASQFTIKDVKAGVVYTIHGWGTFVQCEKGGN